MGPEISKQSLSKAMPITSLTAFLSTGKNKMDHTSDEPLHIDKKNKNTKKNKKCLQ